MGETWWNSSAVMWKKQGTSARPIHDTVVTFLELQELAIPSKFASFIRYFLRMLFGGSKFLEMERFHPQISPLKWWEPYTNRATSSARRWICLYQLAGNDIKGLLDVNMLQVSASSNLKHRHKNTNHHNLILDSPKSRPAKLKKTQAVRCLWFWGSWKPPKKGKKTCCC